METKIVKFVSNFCATVLAAVVIVLTAKAFVSEFLLSREYTSAYPAKITASSQKLTAEFAVSMGRFGNPMLKKYFCEFGIASEEDSYGLTKEEHDGICRMTWQKVIRRKKKVLTVNVSRRRSVKCRS